MFSTFGNILSYNVAQDEEGYCKGYGVIQFDTIEAAINAINNINGMTMNGKVVLAQYFVPKKEREKSLLYNF